MSYTHFWTSVSITKPDETSDKLDAHLEAMSEEGWELVNTVLNNFGKFSYMFFWKKPR